MRSPFLALVFSAFSETAMAGICPPYPVGVSEAEVEGNIAYVAVAEAHSLSESDESLKLAAAEARAMARGLLLKKSAGYGRADTDLRGALDISTCHIEELVYATVMLSNKNVGYSNGLSSAIENSIHSSPTPQLDMQNDW